MIREHNMTAARNQTVWLASDSLTATKSSDTVHGQIFVSIFQTKLGQ